MEKIWIFTSHACINSEDCGTQVKAFSTKEKAKEAFDEYVKMEKNYLENSLWKIDEDDTAFEAYLEGYYNDNHSHGWIQEVEIDEK